MLVLCTHTMKNLGYHFPTCCMPILYKEPIGELNLKRAFGYTMYKLYVLVMYQLNVLVVCIY